jgi:hypothetical protein
MTMMRLVMEAVMVFAVVGILVFMTKISAKEDSTGKSLLEDSDGDKLDNGSQ